ncbi:hypothetical protein [Enterobacter asburiae]|uniref:hypothetical protein n=1 Tax=Enterobacter asburiae TaxID=61645 RepID=UPI00292A921E|nr:hypothetical protein [Enterobacter asburiae]HEB5888587.1 hypothetical protein [Enterobacter asburiae]
MNIMLYLPYELDRHKKMTKKIAYSLEFTSNDIQRIAKSSVAEVAAKQLVTEGKWRQSGISQKKSAFAHGTTGQKVQGGSSKTTKARDSKNGSQLVKSNMQVKNSVNYSSQQAVDVFNQAFKRTRG